MKLKVLSLLDSWKLIQKAVGDKKKQFNICVLLLLLSSIFLGVAISFFIPLFKSIENKNFEQAWFYIYIITTFMILSSICRWFGQDYDYKGYMTDSSKKIQLKLGQHLRDIPLGFLSKKRTGEINELILGNTSDALSYTITVLMLIFNALITPLTIAIATLFFEWRIGLLLLVLFPILIFLYHQRKLVMAKGLDILIQALASLKSEIIEFTQGIFVLRMSDSVGDKEKRLSAEFKNVKKIQENGQNLLIIPNLIVSSVVEIGLLIIATIGMVWVLQGTLSVMVLAALFVVISRFSEPLSAFVSMSGVIELGVTSFKNINNFLKIKPLELMFPYQVPDQYNIQIKNLDFSYENDNNKVLNNINIMFPYNAMTALVGSSGCGKSTLVRMIMRYADPQQGEVLIGGVNIKQMSENELMNLISIVFQDVYLFNDTVLNNLKMGNENLNDEIVYEAAKKANCHDFIMALPNGYSTKIESMGNSLSGGEKQRISIARALIKNAPIIILDEPTSSLDTESEVAVQKAIDVLIQNKTVIVISHRLSTIVAAEKIIVMDKGEIKEEGVHQQLLSNEGYYKRLWDSTNLIKNWHN